MPESFHTISPQQCEQVLRGWKTPTEAPEVWKSGSAIKVVNKTIHGDKIHKY